MWYNVLYFVKPEIIFIIMKGEIMKKGNVFKRIFATTLAVTLIFSNGYSTIPFIGSKAVSEVQAESEPSLILKPQTLYDGGYVVKSKKDENDNVIKWIEQTEEFGQVDELSEENNFNKEGKEIKYSAGGQSVLYIDKGTCLDCEFEADEDFSYFDAYLTNKDGEQLGGYKKVSSNDQSSDSSLSRATLTNNDAIPGSSYIVTKKNGHFQICVNDDAYITLYYHSKNGDVLTGFILKIVALQKTEDFTVKGQDTVVATRKANFTVENPKGGTVGGTDGFRWSVDSSVGSFSKTDRDKAIFTAADAANGKEGSFTVTPYSGIDKSSESNAIIAIKKRGASKTFDINIAKRVKASSVNFKISDQDENYVEETIDDNISDEDWEQLTSTNPTHYYERDGKRYVKYAKYYLAKGSSYLLNDKFDYLPKNSNDIFKYTSSDSRFVTVMQNGTIKGISPGITSITVSPEDENAISDKAYIEVYVQTTDLKPQKEDGTKITSYSMRSSNDIEIDVVEDKDSTERIEALVSHKVSGSNKAYTANVTKRDEVRQLDTEIQWMDGDEVVLTQTLLNPEEYFSTNVKKYKFTAGTILDKQELTVTFKTNRTSGYLENSTDVSTYVSLDLYPMYEGALSLKSASDTDELWTGESDTVSAIVDTSNVADQIGWKFSDENIDSEGNDCLTIDSIDYTNNKVNISAKQKPDSGYVDLTATTKSNPSKSATMRINVKQTAKSVKITGNQAKPTVNVGKDIQLTATQEPASSDETIEWTSSNNDYLTVDEQGLVTGKKVGTAVVTAKTSHSKKTAKISVTIVEAGRISIKKANTVEAEDIGSIDGVVNGTLPVYAVVVDTNNTMQTTAKVDWTVANPEVVDVSYKNDTHTQVSFDFKKVGTTTITVESGAATKTYEVTVTAPISDSKFVSIGGIEDYVYLPNGKIPEINEKAISLVDSRGDNYELERGKDYETSNSYSEGGKAGTYKYTLSQAEGGLYTGSKDVSYNIYKKSLGNGTTADAEIDVKVTDVVYNGKVQLPILDITYKVGDNEQKLIQGQDYTVSTGFTNVGEYEITISGASNGNFKDSFKVSYNILPFDLEANLEDSVRFFDGKQLVDKDSIKDQTYTGSAITPDNLVMVRVSFDHGYSWTIANLVKVNAYGVGDVEYSYSDNIDVGTATVTIEGKNNYTGTITTTFNIVPKNIAETGITYDNIPNYEYTSYEITPDIGCKYNGKQLVKDTDYVLDYENNIDSYVATGNKNALVNVNGTGNYTGFKQLKFVIDQVDLSDTSKVTIDELPDQYDCGSFLKPKVKVRYGNYLLVEGKDYTPFYGKDNGTDLSYNYKVGENAGVVAVLPVDKGNFKATKATTVSRKNGQEIFFNIITKTVTHPADDIIIKRIVSNPDESTDLLEKDTIFVNATGGVTENTTVKFEIEAICNEGECDDPVYANIPDKDKGKFTCNVDTLNLAEGNKAILTVTGGNKADKGEIMLMTKGGKAKPVTVVINDPATKVQLAYDTSKTDMKNHVITNITNGTTLVRERHQYKLVANLSRGNKDTVTWSSSNENVATVDEDGLVDVKKQGNTIITATTKGSELFAGGVKGSITMNVAGNVMAKTVSIENPVDRIRVGKKMQLVGTATSEDGSSVTENLVWKSDDENVIKITEGKDTSVATIEAVQPGTTTIHYGSEFADGKEATLQITVFIPISTIAIKKTDGIASPDIGIVEGVVNTTLNVFGVVVDEDTQTQQTNAKVDWSVDNEDIVTVGSKNGYKATLSFHKVGTTTITVKSGDATETYNVTVTAPMNGVNGSNQYVNVSGIQNYTYLPNGKVPVITETAISTVDSKGDDYKLQSGTDYVTSNSYFEGGNVGLYKYTLSQTSGGLYTGSKDIMYNIYQKSLGDGTTHDDEIEVKVTDVVYNGKVQLPELKITYKVGDNEQELVQGQDYTVSAGNTNAGKYELTVTGASNGNFKDSFKVSYNILPFNIETNRADSVRFFDGKQMVEADSIKDQTYTGAEIKPDNLVMVRVSFDKGNTWANANLVAKADGSGDVKYSYSENIDAGIATVTIEGTNNYEGTISTTFNILPKNISEAGVLFANVANQEYTSKQITPDVAGTYNSISLKNGVDYTLDYDNNIDSYTVTGKDAIIRVSGKGNYTGQKEVKFRIDQVDLSDTTKVVIDEIPDQYDCGTFLKPEVSVHYGDYDLVEGKDFTAFYGKDNGTDLEYNYQVGTKKGVVAILPVDKGNFKASKATTISRKNGQEIFFNIVAKTVKHKADSISIKRRVSDPHENTDLIEANTIFVNASGGVTTNTTVGFDIEAICSDGDCDDPIFVDVPDEDKNKFKCNVETLDLTKGNKAILTVTGGNQAAKGNVYLMTKSGTARLITVVVNDPATKVQLAYDTSKTDMKNHVITNIANGTTLVRERHEYQLVANLSRGNKDTVTWSSSNESVATVDDDGKVIVKKQGNTIITATTNSSELFAGGIKGSVTMHVAGNVMAETVTIGNAVEKLRVGKKIQLTGSATSKDGSSVTEKLVWKSDDENVIKITDGKDTSNATIEAVQPGTTTIHYGSEFADGKEASVTITVYIPTSTISIKKTDGIASADIGVIEGQVNKTLPVFGVVVDEDTNTQQTNAKVDWIVANENIVTADSQNGYRATLSFHKVGKTTITVKSGDATETYNVTVTAPINGENNVNYVTVTGVEDYTYLPNGKVPSITETAVSSVDSRDTAYELQSGKDYVTSNSYVEGGKAGTYKYTLSQATSGLYTGSKDVSYKILQKSLGNGTEHDGEIDVKVTDVVYNGKVQLPKLDITYKVGDNEQKLIQGQDYSVSQGNTNAGTYDLTVSAVINGNFKDSFKVSYTIEPFDIETNRADSVRFYDGKQLVEADSIKAQTYTGSEIKPDSLVMVRVSFDKGTTWSTTNLMYKADGTGDVKYEYSNNINAGTATVTITGTKNYIGSINTTFEIEPKSIAESGVTFDSVANQEYTSKEVTPDVSGKYNSMTLVKDKDYTLDYDSNIDSYIVSGSRAKIFVTGKGNYTGQKDLEFTIDQVDLSDKTKVIIDEIPDQYECGTFLRPDVTARYGDYVLVEGKDYTTFYGKDDGIDKSYNVLVDNGNEGVVAILPVTKGNFKASTTTSVSRKNGQEIFFNIIDKTIKKHADDVSIKRRVDGGNADLIGGAIYVNATGGVNTNNTVSFDIESIRNDNEESDDPVYVMVPDSANGLFTCNVRTLDITKGNKAVLEITGGTKEAQGYITLMTKSGEVAKDITVFVNDPATKVELAYDTNKTNMSYVTKRIENRATTVYENHDYQLVANLSRGKTDSVTWTSSNESVAIVDENGRVTALKQGSARITATTNPSELYEGGVKGTVTFNVIKNSMAHSVTIAPETVTLQKGKTQKLTGTAKGLNNSVVTEPLEWTTSDEKIVKITAGQDTNIATIEAVAPGTAKVYYGSKQPDGIRGYCEVTVFVPVESINLNLNTKSIEAGNTFELTATLNELATDTFIWETSDPEVVSIDEYDSTEVANTQTVTFHALSPKQTATITVKAASKDNVVATCKVTVTDRLADNVTIDKTSLTVNAGETFKLKGSASNVDGDVTESLIWGFPSDKIECIDGEFTDEPTFRAKQTSGTATITYGSNDKNGKIARCEVTIINSKLTLNTYKVILAPNGTAKLTASYPTGSVGGFIWTSSDESVVKINDTSNEKSNSQTVEIVGVGPGKTAQITVTSMDDSSIKAVCDVTVNHIMADTVSIDSSSLQLELGKTKDLIGTASSNIGTVTEPLGWNTSNSGVVALVGDLSSYTITVKAVAAGTATITYGSKASGGKLATCTIVVKDPNSGSGGNSGGNGGGNSGGNGGGSSGGSNENTLEPGKTATVAGVTYVVNKDSTVTYAGNPKAKGTVRIPASVKIAGKTVNVTSIKAGAFKNNKNITSVIIGNNVKTIGNNAFAGCIKLKKVTIGKNVKSIGNNAFKGCKLITAITIPAKVTSIGSNAFAGCSKLKTVTFKTTKLKKVGKGAFKTIKAGAKFKCPNAKLKAYTKLLKKSGVPKKAKITK